MEHLKHLGFKKPSPFTPLLKKMVSEQYGSIQKNDEETLYFSFQLTEEVYGLWATRFECECTINGEEIHFELEIYEVSSTEYYIGKNESIDQFKLLEVLCHFG